MKWYINRIAKKYPCMRSIMQRYNWSDEDIKDFWRFTQITNYPNYRGERG